MYVGRGRTRCQRSMSRWCKGRKRRDDDFLCPSGRRRRRLPVIRVDFDPTREDSIALKRTNLLSNSAALDSETDRRSGNGRQRRWGSSRKMVAPVNSRSRGIGQPRRPRSYKARDKLVEIRWQSKQQDRRLVTQHRSCLSSLPSLCSDPTRSLHTC